MTPCAPAATLTRARQHAPGPVVWIQEMLPRADVIKLYSYAAVFVCPFVYEPFGIINLQAMACETPVVASAVGGIPGIVVDGETGLLVPLARRAETDFEPKDPDVFAHALSDAINRLMAAPELRRSMGKAGRHRVEEHFSWRAVAAQTLEFYRYLLQR
jgi:alpha-maltose-1-phosphate synthase